MEDQTYPVAAFSVNAVPPRIAPSDRWSCWLAWLIEAGHDLPCDGWTVQRPFWGHDYINGPLRLTCISSGVFGRHRSEIACYVERAEAWRAQIPHEVGYGPRRETQMAVDRISAGGIPLARY